MEWCSVWKGSLGDCLSHLHEKHGGSQYGAMNNLGKFFPRGLCPGTFGGRLFARMCLVWRWTSGCFMSLDAGWSTNTGCTVTPSSSGAAGVGDEQTVGFGGSGHGHCTIDATPHHDTGVWIGDGGCPGGVFPSCSASVFRFQFAF